MSHIRKKHKNVKAPRILAVIIAVILLVTFINISFAAAFVYIGGTAIASLFKDLPNIKDFSPIENALTSKIFAADGKLIGTLHGEQNREIVSFEQLPKNLINAVVSIEDERFYEHKGVDFEGIIRSLIINIKSGGISQGASTLTQQYIRTIYIPEEKNVITYERKLKEAILAYQLEQIYTKNEILDMYLNDMYFGE
ncbi:MAG: transglycosylase domain-containing protein, partial [Actinobacteria bacterium]|nr:transglycosylase domain-containing protein [Actinomycetota bacterium]